MTKAAAARQGDAAPDPGATSDADFAELRSLIVGPEQRQLRSIQSRLDDPAAQARDVGRVLPVAMLLRKDDPQMRRALGPTVEEALTASVRRNPRPLADALFPIFGPAIRKAIAASLSSMLESLNQTLDHSLSWRAVQWRITALRTGKSFAEVVLLNTLLYRVEQVFLIDRDSGILLQHVKAGTVAVQDADMVSGMLTAIRDFVRDSFRVGEEDALEGFKVGDLSVLIAQGPHAILAAVVRGTPPQELRQTLQETIEHVHAQTADALASFSGDTAPFEAVRPILESLLASRYRVEKTRISPVLWIALGAILLGLGLWIYLTLGERSRWHSYLDALRAEPGIVVVSGERADGKYVVAGLRDPLARNPAELVSASGLERDDVVGRWQMYQALDAPIVLQRARQLLRAPASVELSLSDGVLTATGDAPSAWVAESTRIAPLIPGVTRLDATALLDAEARTIARDLAATPILFVKGSTAFETGGAETLRAHLGRISRLDALAAERGVPYSIEVVGHADGDGPAQTNDSLSVSRAGIVRAAIDGLGLRHIRTTATGAGSRQPVSRNASEADKRANRRVTLTLSPTR